jgi:hypothetical protein
MDSEQYSSIFECLREVLLESNLGIRILADLDVMKRLCAKDPESVDKIRCTFITCCDFLSVGQDSALCPVSLPRHYGSSVQAAFHMTKGILR